MNNREVWSEYFIEFLWVDQSKLQFLSRFHPSDPGCYCWPCRSSRSAAGQRRWHWGSIRENQRHTSFLGLLWRTPGGKHIDFQFSLTIKIMSLFGIRKTKSPFCVFFQVVELLLLRGANKEHRNVSDYTPLSLAASGGYVNIIKILLNAGAEINSR